MARPTLSVRPRRKQAPSPESGVGRVHKRKGRDELQRPNRPIERIGMGRDLDPFAAAGEH